jgi:vacuolar-type H+-ATPase subunit E/Vma4
MATKGIGRPLTIMLRADTDGFSKGIQTAETKLKSLNKSLNKASVFAGIALGGLAVAGREFAVAAAEDQKSAAVLEKTLQSLTGATKEQTAAVESYITQTSLAIGIADDELRPAFARLVRSTDDITKAQELLNLALDISAATSKPLESVTNALGKAYDGSTTALGKLGVGLDKTTLKSGDLDVITKELTTKYGGFAKVAANTADGSLKRLDVAINEAKESIGFGLLPFVVKAADAITKWTPKIQENADTILKFAAGIASTSTAIIALNTAVKISIALTKTYTALMVVARTTTLFLAAATGSATAAQILAEATYKKSTTALVLYNVAQAITSAGARIAATSIGILTVALLSNPFTAVAVAVAGLITALVVLKNTNDTTATKVESSYKSYGRGVVIFNKLNQSAANASNSINRVSNAIQEARDVARSKGRNGLLDVNYTPDLVGLGDLDKALGNVSNSTTKLTKAQKAEQKAAEKAAEKAKQQAKAEKEKAKALAETEKALAKATKAAEKIASGFAGKLEKAKAGLDNVKQAFKEYRQSVKDAITSQFSFEKAFETKGKDSFIQSLKAQADAAKDFGSKIAKLVSLGLSRGGLDQIIQAGAEVGGAIADELIAGGPGSIQNVNELVASVDSVAGQIAKSTAGAFFDAGLAQGEALVAGIIQAAKNAGLIYSGGNIKLPTSAAGITNVAALNASASGLATTGSAIGGAGGVNITINGAVNPEETRRQLERLFRSSSRRTGAVNFAGATL